MKEMERMGPHTFLGQGIHDCDQDILLTDASITICLVEVRTFWKVYIQKETNVWNLEKQDKLSQLCQKLRKLGL